MTKQSLRHVEAVLSALSILDCFVMESDLSVKELADMSGMTRNRIMRLCGTLEKKKYLIQDLETKKYGLGFQIMALGKAFEKSFNLVTITRPFLKELAKNTGESASLFVLEGTNRLVLAREDGTQALRYSVIEGERLPIHAGSAGKVILAFGSEEVRRKVIGSKKLIRFTPHTITDPTLLEAELVKVRSKGYALSQSERIIDVASIAAPVFDHKNHLVGAISIAGPVSRFTAIRQVDYLKHALKAAGELSMQLGWEKSNDCKDT